MTDAHNVVDRKENMTLFEIYAVHAINLFHMLFRYPADHPTRYDTRHAALSYS